jgi:rRNA-processing protein FCF1
MAKLMGRRAPALKVETISAENALDVLGSEFRLGKEKIASILRSVGIKVEGAKAASDLSLYREIIACKLGDRSRFALPDEAYLETLDEQLRSFDEIYVDTAPIIQLDYFLYFVTNAEPVLKRRKKKLLILEKTMEELHGLKDNPEKDLEVRVRATIRPDLIRQLAKRGLIRIGDTGSTGIADDHLVSLFRQVGANKSLLLITQDRGLSERIVRLAQELEKQPRVTVSLPWWKRLFGRKEERHEHDHHMVVCKLVEEGKLKRCYICPECNESYYDDLHDCEGMVLCGRCYLDLKEQEARQVEVNKKKREAELKAEEERQRKLEEEEKRLEAERSKQTVAQRLEQQRKKLLKIGLIALPIVLLLLILLLLILI